VKNTGEKYAGTKYRLYLLREKYSFQNGEGMMIFIMGVRRAGMISR
jgi:hypothetical protein